MKYEIIPNIAAENLVKFCFSFLEDVGITELPDCKIGERRILFENNLIRISFMCDGERCGYFIYRRQDGEWLTLRHSARFKY